MRGASRRSLCEAAAMLLHRSLELFLLFRRNFEGLRSGAGLEDLLPVPRAAAGRGRGRRARQRRGLLRERRWLCSHQQALILTL